VYDAPVMRELSARLEAIVQSLRPCRLLADIGTDQGLGPIVGGAARRCGERDRI
jgi:hypothetical protein